MNGPPAGYVPRCGMPVGAPPPSGTAPGTHYATMSSQMSGLAAPQIAHLALRIRFTPTNPALLAVYAMVGGLATFIPAGGTLPTGGSETSPGAGTIVVRTWAADYPHLRRRLPPNVPPPGTVLYGNVNPASFRTAMTPLVAAMGQAALEHLWGLSHVTSAPNRAALETFFLDEVMQGRAAVFLTGRQPIGTMEPESPSATSPAQLELRFLDSGGADLSPVLHLRSMHTWGGAEFTGHPLIAQVATISVAANLYVAFEVYNLTTHAFDRVPAGVTVELRDYDPVSEDDLEASATTNAQGMAHFHFASMDTIADSDLYFKALTAGRSVAGHTLPAEWSTMGWRTGDDTYAGYYEDFTGSQLGDAAHPLVFRIGVDFHGRLRWTDNAGTARNSPPGLPFGLHGGMPELPTFAMPRTDDAGEVHGLSFDFRGGDTVAWGVNFEIQDLAHSLRRALATAAEIPGGPPLPTDFDSSFSTRPSRVVYASNGRTSIGTHSAPVSFTLDAWSMNVAQFFLRTWRELSIFLWHVTGHAWAGINDLAFYFDTIGGNSYSWPVGEVNIDDTQHWQRDTVIHELAHQLMWREAGFTTWTIATSVLTLCLRLYHSANYHRNPEHALIEGWAEYVEGVFTMTGRYSVMTLDDSSTLFSTPNRGESVEGAFANALLDVTGDLIMPASATATIPVALDGNVATTAPWITNGTAQAAFQSMIWGPLQDLSTGSGAKTTTRFVNAMRTRNPTQWHRIRRRLARWNLANGAPNPTTISPAVGSVAGGIAVTVRGTDFMEGSQLLIGGVAATSVVVTGHDTLTAVTGPSTAGPKDVVVVDPAPTSTVAGRPGTLAGGFAYQ